MKISCIYKIKSLSTDKIYIGSAIDFVNRKRCHISDLNKNRHHSILLQRIVNKYGIKDLEFIIIERVFDKSILIKKEQYYIDTFKPHLNIMPKAGSALGNKLSEETKAKLRELNSGKNNKFYGKSHTKETIELLRSQKIGKFSGMNNPMYGVRLLGELNPMYGKSHSKEAIEKIKYHRSKQVISEDTKIKMRQSAAKLGDKINAVKVICLNNNKLYSCIKEAAIELGVCRQDISKVCRGKLKLAKGYSFKYA